MPVQIEKLYGGPHYDRWRLTPTGPEDDAALQKRRAQIKAWQREDERTVRDKGHRGIVHRQIEHPMTRDLIPENVTLSKGKTLPDFIEDGPAGPMVSARLKALIEEAEPAGSGHQFLPVAVQTKSRAPYDGDWYAWDVIRRLDATDETSIALSPVGGVVDGNHIWSNASPLRKGFEYGHMWSTTDRRLLPSVVGTAAVWRD